jgi:hypothetical protein
MTAIIMTAMSAGEQVALLTLQFLSLDRQPF